MFLQRCTVFDIFLIIALIQIIRFVRSITIRLIGNLLDTCSNVWTVLAFNVFEFVCWVKLGDKISSPVSFGRAEEFLTKLRGKERDEAKEWLMKEREFGWGGFVKDVFHLFYLDIKDLFYSNLMRRDWGMLRTATDGELDNNKWWYIKTNHWFIYNKDNSWTDLKYNLTTQRKNNVRSIRWLQCI